MSTQRRNQTVAIHATPSDITEFRSATSFYLQSVRQGINQFEYFLSKIKGSSDDRVVASVPGGVDLVHSMRADLLHFEDKWNAFNDVLESQIT